MTRESVIMSVSWSRTVCRRGCGRHRGLPVALDRAVRLPKEQLDDEEEEDATEGPTPAISAPPPPTVAVDQSSLLVDVNHLLEISQVHVPEVDLPPVPDVIPEDDDSDEDMEMVEVPVIG